MEQQPPFYITIYIDRKAYKLRVERVYIDEAHERYLVTAGKQTYLFQNNWPVLRRHALKHRRPTWELLQGNIRYRNTKEDIQKAIEMHVTKKPL